jgi:ABC-type branched-subunit amino acid transport system substrate-binding protein
MSAFPRIPRRLLRALLVLSLAASPSLQAQKVSQPLLIGMNTPLTGPHAAYGRALEHGVRMALDRANASGGVGGRLLGLAVMDDQGDPARAAANARQLLERGAVALTGVHGGRATAAVAEALQRQPGGAPVAALVAPVTGAEPLRSPPLPGVFHLRAGVADEASAAMLHLDTLGITRYAFISQNDLFGQSGRERLNFELVRIGMRPLADEQVDPLGTPEALSRVVDKVCALGPEALVLATDAQRARAALVAARSQSCAAQYLVFSETGATLAERPAGQTGRHPMAGLLVTQAVPHPSNAVHPLVLEYQRALGADAARGSHASMEGYLAMRVIQEALRACPGDTVRACLLQVLATRSFDLPGMRVQFGASQRQSRPFVEINLLDSEGRFRR